VLVDLSHLSHFLRTRHLSISVLVVFSKKPLLVCSLVFIYIGQVGQVLFMGILVGPTHGTMPGQVGQSPKVKGLDCISSERQAAHAHPIDPSADPVRGADPCKPSPFLPSVDHPSVKSAVLQHPVDGRRQHS